MSTCSTSCYLVISKIAAYQIGDNNNNAVTTGVELLNCFENKLLFFCPVGVLYQRKTYPAFHRAEGVTILNTYFAKRTLPSGVYAVWGKTG